MNGKRLRDLRTSIGRSQDFVAENLSLSREAYSKYECGLRNPSIETLIALSDYYGVSLDFLLGRTDYPTAFESLDENRKEAIKGLVNCSDLASKIIADIAKLDSLAFMQDESQHNQQR